MTPIISFEMPPYIPDRRGGKLDSYKVSNVKDRDGELLLLCGPDEVADQIWLAAKGTCGTAKLGEKSKKKYTHAFYFPGGVPGTTTDLADMLQSCVSIPPPEGVDHAVALDWYTIVDEETDELVHTEAGNWINWTKHASNPTFSNSVRSRRKMVNALVNFIQAHPLYASATAIVAAPGHLADGNSFGEKLARDVAKNSRIPFVESSSPGPRPAQFDTKQDLSEAFTVEGELSGTVIVVDDVYQSGGSATGAAAAARRAGAGAVVFLAVARTIRN